jgi:hypothetical protein
MDLSKLNITVRIPRRVFFYVYVGAVFYAMSEVMKRKALRMVRVDI